jgi:hypothetical protein
MLDFLHRQMDGARNEKRIEVSSAPGRKSMMTNLLPGILFLGAVRPP